MLLYLFLDRIWIDFGTHLGSKIDPKSIKNRYQIDQKSIPNRSKIHSFEFQEGLGVQDGPKMAPRYENLGSLAVRWPPPGAQVGAKLSLKSTPKLLAFSNPISKPLGFDVGSILGRFSGSKIDTGAGSS